MTSKRVKKCGCLSLCGCVIKYGDKVGYVVGCYPWSVGGVVLCCRSLLDRSSDRRLVVDRRCTCVVRPRSSVLALRTGSRI